MYEPSLAQGPCKTSTGLAGWSWKTEETEIASWPVDSAAGTITEAETVPDGTGATEMACDSAKEQS